ncbi:hypothetical protein B5S31_g828 [[Candida] boidinii]|nr:hypothetical protein B5S31_g828 [[Candida] boidinii]
MLSNIHRGSRRINIRKYTTQVDSSKILKKYPIGSEVSGYVINKVLPVPELNLTAIDLSHKRTGAKHLHIDRQDKNNVFSIIFKTNPPNSTGLPHILEHTTLCGSENYPVRDPFFKMLNRSLSNFMNAMTGHDYTFYPFATTNKVDFKNLMNVYLDSTLRPLLKEEDFYQEGWRLENEVTNDKKSDLNFKGVVYNEMKGQLSDSSYYFWIKFQESIYPSLNNSGGDPTKMTNLNYTDLVEFHSRFYHPSNARTYTYGNIPLKEHLTKINEEFSIFGKRNNNTVVKQPIDLSEIKEVSVGGPVDPMIPLDSQYKTSLTWFTGKPENVYESFLLKILSTLLMDGHSSPLYQKLIESGLSTDFTINSGMDPMTAVNFFTIGLQGINEEVSKNLQQHVIKSLEEAKLEGFSPDKIKAIIHQLELSRKVENASFGLSLLNSLVPGWVNNNDPLLSLEWNKIINQFNEDYSKQGSKLLTDLIDKYFIDKPYFKYEMVPDESLPEKTIEEEQERLKSKVDSLSSEDKDVLYERGLKLLEKQTEKEDLSCLPTLSVSDIAREGDFSKINHRILNDNNSELQTRTSSKANGISYFRAQKTLTSDELPQELIKYLPLFTQCLTNLGTHDKSMATLEDQIKLYTGGLNASTFVHGSLEDPSVPYLKFGLSGLSLDGNFEKLLSLWTELLNETNFNNIPKLSTLIKSISTDNLSDVVSSGHGYARTYASSFISPVYKLKETLGGIEQVKFLSELGKIEADGLVAQEVVPKLEKIKEIILNGSGFKYSLTSSRESIKTGESEINKFNSKLSSFKTHKIDPYDIKLREEFSNSTNTNFKNYVQIPAQVSFASMAYPGVSYLNKDGASLQILSQLLTFKYLHSEIREKGGAYGGGATYDGLNGIFNYYSYRDPTPFQSVNVFKDAPNVVVEKIKSGEISLEDLDQSKLTIFQKVDAPISVEQEGMSMFNYGIDDEVRQERREALLEVELEDVIECAEKYDTENTSESIIGSAKETEPEMKGWSVTELK